MTNSRMSAHLWLLGALGCEVVTLLHTPRVPLIICNHGVLELGILGPAHRGITLNATVGASVPGDLQIARLAGDIWWQVHIPRHRHTSAISGTHVLRLDPPVNVIVPHPAECRRVSENPLSNWFVYMAPYFAPTTAHSIRPLLCPRPLRGWRCFKAA